MELILSAIDQRLLSLLEKVGIVSQARRVCAIDQLNIYRYAHAEPKLTAKKSELLEVFLQKQRMKTQQLHGSMAARYMGYLK